MAKRMKYRITISYGYDIHTVKVSAEQCADILLGKLVELTGQGFIHEEDGWMKDYWVFNETKGEASFHLENGAQFRGAIDSKGVEKL
jgi:hypothetical protein